VTKLASRLENVPVKYRPAVEIFSMIGDKWTVAVIFHLGAGKMRFNELRRETEGISQKMLAATLRGLERDGFITRTIFPVIPPRVEYELTQLGTMLLDPIKALGAFAIQHRETVDAARQRFDEDMGLIVREEFKAAAE
jgi:DNA-binding HxlR family transcriptional regulator